MLLGEVGSPEIETFRVGLVLDTPDPAVDDRPVTSLHCGEVR